MKIIDVTNVLENIAPLQYQEGYDNSGLTCGDENTQVTGVMICIDCIEAVIDEAIATNCNLVISHHPLLFGKGLMKITGQNFVERTLIKAIKNNIAIYATHTNLDNVFHGVNSKISEKLSLKKLRILVPKADDLIKLVTFVPVLQADKVRNAIFAAGGGNIGNYSECSFNVMGTGTFRAGELAKPFAGENGKQQKEQEIRIETIFPSYLKTKILHELKETHPYEEVAYDLYSLENINQFAGSGMIGELETEMNELEFLKKLKSDMHVKVLRHSALLQRKVRKIALCGGSGSFLLEEAIKQGADVFVSADFKYHRFFDADSRILIADIGHYESEQFTKELISAALNKNFTTFAVRLSETNTNPINYF